MPRVDELIPWESHKEDCPFPVAKRLYIRDYDKNGKQRFVSWGAVCKNCVVILKQDYEKNPTKNELQRKRDHEQWLRDHGKTEQELKEYEDNLFKSIFGPRPRLTPKERQEIQRRNIEYRKNRKLQQRKRRLLGPMSPIEVKYRQRIRLLKNIYENDRYYSRYLRNNDNDLINWDLQVVEKYLETKPSVTEMRFILEDLSPWQRYNRKQAKRFRGYIPDPAKAGWFKKDRSNYHKDDKGRWRYNSQEILGEYEKLVIQEAEQRQRWMKKKIRNYE